MATPIPAPTAGAELSAAKTSDIAEAAPAAPSAATDTKMKLKKPTISGNLHFTVGSSHYTAPDGSELFHQKGVEGLAYVFTTEGSVHIFSEKGEVETDSQAILSALSAKFEAGLEEDDTSFEVADFDNEGSTYDLSASAVGGVLTDQEGTPVFTKNEDGSWHHEGLGIDLDEKVIRPIFERGELIPEKTPESEALTEAFRGTEAVNFKEMTTQETQDALDAMEPGVVLEARGKSDTDVVSLKKSEDGMWSWSGGDPVASSVISHLKDTLTAGDGADVSPKEADDDSVEKPAEKPTEKTVEKPAEKDDATSTPIDKYGALNAFPEGTKIKNAASSDLKGITLEKTAEGWFWEDKAEYFTPVEMEKELKAGALFLLSSSEKTAEAPAEKAVEPTAEAPAEKADSPADEDEEDSDSLISFEDSEEKFESEDIQEVLDALKSHSGPQVSYSLKSVPDNPFADKDMLAKLKDWSKQAYPDLPPKQAAVSLLENKLGLSSKEAIEGDIAVGSEGDDIKKTATGLTGGLFTSEEISEAVDILKSFTGKNFKSELSKKNNRLGQLSPNSLVGFDKDKTQVKEKFLALLESKLKDTSNLD